MKYRKEIDGLRAIAVLPVLFFHGNFPGFSGGYIGVDIFFVISGYLITLTIIRDINKDGFSIIRFYERRARRIIPALGIVLLVTTLLVYIFLPPDLLESYSRSLISVVTFTSNFYFFRDSGYFAAAADEKPLIHIWSLAVEEQFYLFFPLLLSMLWSFGKKKARSLILLLGVLSLVYAQYLVGEGALDANFYLIFSRAWELFTGAVVALIPFEKLSLDKRIRDGIGILSLMMIAGSILFYTGDTPFPSVYTLLPVLATAAIIVFINQETRVGSFLSNRAFVFIGLISYSLYLWHQPLFALIRVKTLGEPPAIAFIPAILISIGLAYLSWKYIETPFRDKGRVKRSTIFRFALISTISFFMVGAAGMRFDGFPGRFDLPSYQDSMKISPERKDCHTSGKDYLPPDQACQYYGENVTWAVLGDSHVVEPAYALARALKQEDVGLVHLSFSSCPPAYTMDVKRPGCTEWFRESMAYLLDHPEIKNVFLGFRYSAFLFGRQMDTYPEIPNQLKRSDVPDKYADYSDDEVRELYWQSLYQVVEDLRESGKNIYLMYPIPELPVNIKNAVVPYSIFSQRTMLDLDRATTKEYYFARNEYIINKLDTLSYGDGLYAIKPFDILCDDYCPAIKDGQALYYDDHHLSIYGAEYIAQAVLDQRP